MAKLESTSPELKEIIDEQIDKGSRQRVEVDLHDGRTIKTNAQSLINYHLNNYHNWHCEGYGSEEIFIDHTGFIYGGRCLVKRIGHASDDNLRLLDNGIMCPRTICMCSTDVMLTKDNLGQPQGKSEIENR
jgi:uncharacterized Fe-S cluster-containing radical SAM superfamily enzyme